MWPGALHSRGRGACKRCVCRRSSVLSEGINILLLHQTSDSSRGPATTSKPRREHPVSC